MRLVEGDPFGGQGDLDHLGVEDVVEGEDLRLAEGLDLLARSTFV